MGLTTAWLADYWVLSGERNLIAWCTGKRPIPLSRQVDMGQLERQYRDDVESLIRESPETIYVVSSGFYHGKPASWWVQVATDAANNLGGHVLYTKDLSLVNVNPIGA